MDKFKLKIEDKQLYLFLDNNQIAMNIKENTNKITKTIPCEVIYMGQVTEVDILENYIHLIDSSVSKIYIDKNNNTSVIMLPSKKLFFPDIVYLALCMFANFFQSENKYFLQSSVVKYDDEKSIMFIGEPNSGKTTLSVKLALTGNWDLISNDNVLVKMNEKSLNSIAGTKSVQLRLGGIKMFFPNLLPLINEKDKLNSRNEWDIKIYIDHILKNEGVSYADKSNISDIYFISTNQSNTLSIRDRELIDKKLLIYEQLTKQIRSNRYVFTSLAYPLPSFENEQYLLERYKMAESIATNVGIYELKGDVDKAVYQLRKKYEK
ncbi:MAG: hypothetical protein GX951_00095 [Mollicutes bacterium]|nr:hypothetical protein [Mollicutes bacterium]